MLSSILKSFFGTHNDRFVKSLQPYVDKINSYEDSYSKLSDQELCNNTNLFKERIAKGESLDSLLPEAFANVREASKRTLGLRHFDVQLIGGIVLHKGMIAEMKTGEGKTLVATLAVYLNALSQKGVHVITVNDYLAKRDCEWMKGIYNLLGLSANCIYSNISDADRKNAYDSDITYGTNHEFGFDYLRDNMKFRKKDMVMRDFNYAIVDEVDSILIDEARTPLIISGAAEDSSDLYIKLNDVVAQLTAQDYEKDEKQNSVILTDAGIENLERLLKSQDLLKSDNLYDAQNISIVHHAQLALKARVAYTKDVDYIVKNNKVIIIDEFTGRMMDGRRYSDGLHQAIEAKEHVEIAQENQTLASITYQNFFRLYPKLSGMAGTAMTESTEFEEIYNLRVVDIPTNKPVARIDHDDEIYLSAIEKYKAVINLVKQCQEKRQPVLIGTTSIEKSELISSILEKENIKHNVLNARQHEKEAYIVAMAGCLDAVTVATNMAGRGTDIKLGGNFDMRVQLELANMEDGEEKEKAKQKILEEIKAQEELVKQAGGLYIIGTERHESRRIDNQLRGRSGRQGDAGASKFFISLDDDLMRIFSANDKLKEYLKKMGAKDDEVISHKYISRSLEKAQQRVEARNFDVRKHLLKYDDVMNEQRKIIYSQRLDLMQDDSFKDDVNDIRVDVIENVIEQYLPDDDIRNDFDFSALNEELKTIFDIELNPIELSKNLSKHNIKHTIKTAVFEKSEELENSIGSDIRNVERALLLKSLDHNWKNHLLTLDHIRQGINLRAYAQSNPLNEYKREAFNHFQLMMNEIKVEYISRLHHFQASNKISVELEQILGSVDFSKVNLNFEDADEILENDHQKLAAMLEKIKLLEQKQAKTQDIKKSAPIPEENISRNSMCKCGSGKRYKNCCGK